jgi:hypothetical protein
MQVNKFEYVTFLRLSLPISNYVGPHYSTFTCLEPEVH